MSGTSAQGSPKSNWPRLTRGWRPRAQESAFDGRRRRPREPHWVKPQLVAQVRFTEWTDEGRLRHPAYLGLRDDVEAKAVRREAGGTLVKEAEARLEPPAHRHSHNHEGTKTRCHEDGEDESTSAPRTPASTSLRTPSSRPPALQLVIDQLDRIEAARKAKAALALPDGDSLEVSNLHKISGPARVSPRAT